MSGQSSLDCSYAASGAAWQMLQLPSFKRIEKKLYRHMTNGHVYDLIKRISQIACEKVIKTTAQTKDDKNFGQIKASFESAVLEQLH